ncbi:hypothetical protein CKA55_00560 [Arcobacter suis]|uniref:Uncharacterized protein n=1 Tax=Arcobacter suis CECT 7833 TaxID=663365 RepID=A0AAD0SP84_9BACT|nr:hypothetical protein [Arcobacter suis]AXX89136.1 hypothetical protein ASUIS_0640 [Arcobacter suis CECT 7833]RWS47861.1 hypothetical protein CKA55_00560 [Arcobacter suis]
MTILLICETAIIEHIFTLVCKRLHVNLTIQKTNSVNDKFDLIIIDQSFIDDKFNTIKQFSKKLGAICSEELPFDKSRDFIIQRPFLPTKLEEILIEQIEIIKEDRAKEKESDLNRYEEDEDVFVPITKKYIESLDSNHTNYSQDDFYEEEDDESIINPSLLNIGGILDHSELSKINNILREDVIQNEINLEKTDWKDIAAIIDDALEEVKEYEFDLTQPPIKHYNLVLSNFHINELRPLLEKFDQTVIDRLSSGESVDIRLSLKG